MIDILRASRIPGMMPLQCLVTLVEQAAKRHTVVEVGCWQGRTTRALYDNCSGKIWAVDTWLGSPELNGEIEFMKQHSGDPDWLMHEFQRNFWDTDPDRLIVTRMDSLSAAQHFTDRGLTFDMVFIDAAHDYASVKADLAAWWPLIKPGGLICGDDYQSMDVARAVSELFQMEAAPPDGRLWGVTKDL